MNTILRCVESDSKYFVKDKAYLFINGILTCNSTYGTNLYFSPASLKQQDDKPIETVDDVNNYFKHYNENVRFKIDDDTARNWGIE